MSKDKDNIKSANENDQELPLFWRPYMGQQQTQQEQKE
jgi:hypothetical protein